uniref:LITAF domain-containing protein n=1 Tax=Anopheles atroparvus TaxID=41427 RepID=A0A8W7NYM2_ANOAO
MCVLKVKCVYCGLVIECKREDTALLLQHLQREHPERAMDFPVAPNAAEHASKNIVHQASELAPSDADCSETDSETEELLRRIRLSSKAVERYSSTSSVSTDETDNNVPDIINQRSPGSRTSQRSVMYQTSLSSWRPGGHPIGCPNCGAKQTPIVRSHANSVTWSSTMATCLLHCWPLCCLSWLLGESANEYLHCSRCDQLLTKPGEECRIEL